VFIPTWASRDTVAKLSEIGAELVECERRGEDPPGDPCYHRFREAVAAGALPFSCQGSDNGLAIDGGRTLGFELAAQHRASEAPPLSHLFVQVGGGALASSTWQALETAHAIGALPELPALVAVQTEGAHPLKRAWDRLTGEDTNLDAAVTRARSHRSEHMWPWESEPKSIASGILDDETYDWWQVVRGIATTGGSAVLASEADIERAEQLAKNAGIAASATGASGYAGVIGLRRRGELGHANPAVLFTGVQR
jgi:threonine synthase